MIFILIFLIFVVGGSRSDNGADSQNDVVVGKRDKEEKNYKKTSIISLFPVLTRWKDCCRRFKIEI